MNIPKTIPLVVLNPDRRWWQFWKPTHIDNPEWIAQLDANARDLERFCEMARQMS